MEGAVASLSFRDTGAAESSLETLEISLSPHVGFLVGRRACDEPEVIYVQLDSPLVSKEHFRIYMIMYEDTDCATFPPMFYCEDLNSLNGTYVNQNLIGSQKRPGTPFLLSNGDIISIKPDWTFEFKQPVEGSGERLDELQLKEAVNFRNRYLITDRLLGSGMYSKVYLAGDVAKKRQLACKIVDLRDTLHTSNRTVREITSLRQDRERLVREVELLSRLNHPNIVNMRKAFRSEFSLYMFMELAPGGDLMSFVTAQGGYLTDLYARVIVRQVAIAVAYLHSKNIVHRDLKPDNILVTHTGIGHRVVVTDFGCASLIRPGGRMASQVGTWDYIAPEVYRANADGGRPYTKAVDMWSLGILTFCLLTGECLADFEQVLRYSQGDIAVRIQYSGRKISGRQRWRAMTDRAKHFLTGLLILEPEERITAEDAVNHIWFIRPWKIGRELKRLYDRSIKDWKPRRSNDSTIEILPGRIEKLSPVPQLIQVDKPRRKRVLDATASRYFGLERHLREPDQPREVSQRNKQQLIDQLKKSGETFMQDGDISTYTPKKSKPMAEAPSTPKRSRPASGTRPRRVEANNLFGNVPVRSRAAGFADISSQETMGTTQSQSQLGHGSPLSDDDSMLSSTDDLGRNQRRQRRRRRGPHPATPSPKRMKLDDDYDSDDESLSLPLRPSKPVGSSVAVNESSPRKLSGAENQDTEIGGTESPPAKSSGFEQ